MSPAYHLHERMTRILAILLTILSISHSGWSQAIPDSSKVVRVLSFNIFHGETMKGDFNLDVIAEVIKQAKPDFVALQEVDFKTNRARQMDLATELGWRTNLAPIFARAMKFDGGEYGEAVLSRHSILQSRNIALPHSPGNEPRAALEIITALASGDTIAIVGTHLDHLEDENDRIMQAKKINKVFALNKYPTILAGDLNTIPGSKPIEILEGMWTSSYDKKKPEPTFPSDNPEIKIDYVMFWPGHRWKIVETEVICDPIASDHCAYLVTLQLSERRPREETRQTHQ